MTAVSSSFYRHLRDGGAPVGEIQPTNRRLRGANGSQIDILGCSFCVVSFLGLRTEFPILVCDLSTDAIIGTDTLRSVLPHTLDIKHVYGRWGVAPVTPQGCCFVRTSVHCGTLFYSSILGGSSPLYHSHRGWPVYATQWFARRVNRFL